jgi:hypothetical protein
LVAVLVAIRALVDFRGTGGEEGSDENQERFVGLHTGINIVRLISR